MKHSTQFITKHIDVNVDILKSNAAVGPMRGTEVASFLKEKVKELAVNGLLIIDVRRSNPLQYAFCLHAFGQLVEMVQKNSYPDLRVLFQMHSYHEWPFFRGVLKYYDVNAERNRARESLLVSNLNLVILQGSTDKIEYVGKMSQLEKGILELIIAEAGMKTRDILDAYKSEDVQSVMEALQHLVAKQFLLHPSNEADHYYSINHLITNTK